MKSFTQSLTLAALLGVGGIAHAQVTASPSVINFQGRLAAPSGSPVPDGTYSIKFLLFDAVTAGIEKWNKTVSNVQVKNGTFAVALDGFASDTFNSNLWMEVKIGNDAALTPRTSLVSVPYALKSNIALTIPDASITNAKLAGSLTADKFASGAFNSIAWLLVGNSGTDGTQFLGTTDNQPLVFKTSNIERMRILDNGYIGIGTTTPGAPLEIRGGTLATSLQIFPGTLFGTSTANAVTLDMPGVVGTLGIWDDLQVSNNFNVFGNGAFGGTLAVAGTGDFGGMITASGGTFGRVTATLGNFSGSLTAASGIRFSDGTTQTTSFNPAAGGDLTGTYPNPSIKTDAITTAKLANGSVTSDKLENNSTSLTKVSGGLIRARPAAALDQVNDLGSGSVKARSGWQSFTPGVDGQLLALDLYLTNAGSADIDFSLFLYAGEGTASPIINMLPITVSPTGIGGKWFHYEFDTLSVLSAGQKYTWFVGTHPDLVIPAGATYNAGRSDHGSSFPDYAFRTYMGSSALSNVVIKGGNVGIGTDTPFYKLHVNGSVAGVGNYINLSDRRYKEHIETFPDALATILGLRGVTFDWRQNEYPALNFDNRRQVGFIAQEVEKILPELVSTDKNGYKSVAYANVVPVLVEAVKAQQKQITQLKAKISRMDVLEAKLAELTEAFAQLKASQK